MAFGHHRGAHRSREPLAPHSCASFAPVKSVDSNVTSPISVLVVDEDCALRAKTAAGLMGIGYRVSTASDAGQALAALEFCPEIAVLVTNIELPVMDGQELPAEARRRRPGIRIIFLSPRSGRIPTASAAAAITAVKRLTPEEVVEALHWSRIGDDYMIRL
jgi:DNA-binding NtrC family response regulator